MKHVRLNRAGWHRAEKEFALMLSPISKVSETFLNFYSNVSNDALNRIHVNKDYPVYTGNLHDSIAVGIYKRNAIARAQFMATNNERMARVAQHSSTRKRIVGVEEAHKVVQRYRQKASPKGITITMFVGVPYAEGADRDGPILRRFKGNDYITFNHKPGYVNAISKTFVSLLTDMATTGRLNMILRDRKFVPEKRAGIRFNNPRLK